MRLGTIDTDLIGNPRSGEVTFRDRVHGCSKRRQRTHDARRVVRRGVDPDIKVASRARPTVERQCIRTDDQEIAPQRG